MGTAANRVRSFISGLPTHAVFARRQLIKLVPSRGAVDNTLSRLKSEKVITHLGTGVYLKGVGTASAREIITVKATWFGKEIIDVVSGGEDDGHTFLTNGCKSSFLTIHGRLTFRNIGPARAKIITDRSTQQQVISGKSDTAALPSAH
jgi:hypothetical protein